MALSIEQELAEKDNYQFPVFNQQEPEPDEQEIGDGDPGDEHQALDADEQPEEQEAEGASPEDDNYDEPEESSKTFINPHARARILEREKSQLTGLMRGLWEELQATKRKVATLSAPPVEQEPEIDKDEDPVGYAAQVAKKLNDRMEQEAAMQQQLLQQQQIQQAYNAALAESSRQIQDYRQENPRYTEAADFLLKKTMENLRVSHPHMTAQQMEKELIHWSNETKIQALYQGRNPAELFWQAALWAGYNPSVKTAPRAQETPSKQDARTEIRQERKRTPATISRLSGGAPRPTRHPEDMSSSEFNSWLDKEMADGRVGKKPSIMDVIPDRVLKNGQRNR